MKQKIEDGQKKDPGTVEKVPQVINPSFVDI